MSVLQREGRRTVRIRRPMLLAFGLLLVLSDARALRQRSNVHSANSSSRVTSSRGISVTRILQDGELERLVRWPGICAKETVVNWGDTDVALRQVWLRETGRRLQLIYEGGTLTDCVDEPLDGGDGERSCSSSAPGGVDYDDEASIEVFDVEDEEDEEDAWRIPRELSWLSSTSELRHRCARVRARARNQVVAQHRRRKYTNLLNATHASRKQRRGRSRSRRDLLMIPGTQWCGRGHRATKYTNLGGFGSADACCRRHDTACPFFIPAFETRYGLFNWGISSMMHCACDERFRSCLKMAGAASANFIGKIFFDVLRTKCFILKPQKVCVKWSWMGKCQRHEYRKQAHVRDNVPY